MNGQTASLTKFAYCLVLLGMILSVGLANSGWVSMASGGSPLMTLGLFGPPAALLLGIYRLYRVARTKGALDSPPPTGFASVLRVLGVCGLYFGALTTVLGWIAGPLMRMSMTSRSDSGAEFFAVGMYLSLIGGIGILGLLLFEFSRLLSFEHPAPIRIMD